MQQSEQSLAACCSRVQPFVLAPRHEHDRIPGGQLHFTGLFAGICNVVVSTLSSSRPGMLYMYCAATAAAASNWQIYANANSESDNRVVLHRGCGTCLTTTIGFDGFRETAGDHPTPAPSCET